MAAKAVPSEAAEAVPGPSVVYKVKVGTGPARLVIHGHSVVFGSPLPREVAPMFHSATSMFEFEWSFRYEYCDLCGQNQHRLSDIWLRRTRKFSRKGQKISSIL